MAVWTSGSKIIFDNIKPKYSNLKDEVLNNKYAKISKKAWNDTLKKCKAIFKVMFIYLFSFHVMKLNKYNIQGQIQSLHKKQWSKKLVKVIGLKELIALKLYCDFDDLQKEFKKCFRSPYNQDNKRISSFYHWYFALNEAFIKSKSIQSFKKYNVLFHGISSIMNINKFKGKYHGPLSTTTDISVARSFAGKNGMIIVIEPILNDNDNKPLNISPLSQFSDEQEILLFNQYYNIKNIILSSSFDQDFAIYDQMYPSQTSITTTNINYGESEEINIKDIENVQRQNQIVEYHLKYLSECIQCDAIIDNQQIIGFLYKFITSNHKQSKFERFINKNIRFILESNNSNKKINLYLNNNSNLDLEEIKKAFSTYFSTINISILLI